MEQNDATTALWIVPFILVAFPVFFVGIWCFVVQLISIIGGWRAVAQRYPAKDRPPGRDTSAANGMFGVASYKFVLTIVVADVGLYLATPRFFRIGHPPLLIPWAAIRNGRLTEAFGWGFVTFDVDEPSLARVRLPAHALAGAPVSFD